MESNPGPPPTADGEVPSSSSSPSPATAGPTVPVDDQPPPPPRPPQPPSRYESQKRRDWNTFLQYLKNHKPPLSLARCSGAHVIEFLKYLDQFGKTKVHASGCGFFGDPSPPSPCACPLRQAWGSLDALIGRLRAAYEESGGRPESNPFAAKAVRIFLREVRESQAKARGIPYDKRKRKKTASTSGASSSTPAAAAHQQIQELECASASSCAGAGAGEGSSIAAAAAVPTPSSTALASAATSTAPATTS